MEYSQSTTFWSRKFVLICLHWICLLVCRSLETGSGHLYFSNGTDILKFSRDNRTYQSVFGQGGRIVGLAVDKDDGLLFWSDIGLAHRAIYRAFLDGTGAQVIVTDVAECNGMSADWVSNHLYWTDAGRLTLEVANYDGTGRRILVGHGLQIPRGIVVDPVFGYVFWADQGSRVIERAGLDGGDRRVLVSKDLYWPNQLAVSYPTRRLYWVDAKHKTISSCDLDGAEVVLERELEEESTTGFGLVVIGNNAIVSTWFKPRIFSTFVASRTALWTEELRLPDSNDLFSLVSTAPSLQPPGYHPCGQKERGGCSHLCLPTRGAAFRCACPSFGGTALSFSAKSCEVPSELLFFTLKESGQVGFISLTGAQSHDLTLVGRSSQPSAVTYDPIEQVVYWSDVKEHVIYRVSLAGGEQEMFLNRSDGIGVVDGLALDWIARRLYFTNMGHSEPGLDSTLYSWHRVEVVSLDRAQRKTLITDAERPRGLDIDMVDGYLFFGDWGRKPKIVQSLLDGTQAEVILDANLSNPNGLACRDGHLFVADSNFDNRTGGPHVRTYDLRKRQWQDLKLGSNLSMPMGVALKGQTLYYTDWLSLQPGTMGFIKSYDLRFGVDNNVILWGHQPTGLHYSPVARKRQDTASDVCETNTGCSHACVRVPSSQNRLFKCLCPDQSPKILASNFATCDRPENFLLYADLNTIQLVSLDKDTEPTPHILMYDDVVSNFVALTYDETTDTIYWSDLTRKRIYSSPFNDITPHEVHTSDLFMDGVAVESDRQRLYFTGYNASGYGLIARINLQRHESNHHVVLSGLHNPRAIHLVADKKLMFWTEYGDKDNPPSIYRAKINGARQKRIMSTGLFWPNAISSQNVDLYVGDGAGRIFIMDFNGSKLRELSFLKGSVFHVYGLVVYDHLLFYSDWYSKGVYMVDMITGHQEPMAEHLSRPTALVIFHPANLSANNECQTAGAKCDEICVPVPRTYRCSCHLGSKLAADNHTCLKMDSPWEVAEASRCKDVCDMNALCAQLVPQLEYRCVCRAGYEGNGKSCGACGKDFYKAQLNNVTCFPCPLGSTTGDQTTATQCSCTQPGTRMVNNICTKIMDTTTQLGIAQTTEEEGDIESSTDVISSTFSSTVPPIVNTDFTVAQQELSIGFIGPCQPDDPVVKEAIRQQILGRLEVCEWAACSFENVSIYCAPPPPRRRENDLSTFEVRWTVMLHNRDGLQSLQVETTLNRMKQALTLMSAKPLTLGLPQHFQTIPNTVKYNAPLYWTCLSDQLIRNNGCSQIGLKPKASITTATPGTINNITAAAVTVIGSEQPTDVTLYDSFPPRIDPGKPYFKACPASREVALQPNASGRAFLEAETALDSYGHRLPLISTTPIDSNRLILHWSKGSEQTVILNALDNWKQRTTCQFQVTIIDTVPPVFKSCPSNIIRKTGLPAEKVSWPKPVAEDNSLVVTVIGSHEVNSEFAVGVTEVNYTAVDESGNTEECRFTITVILEQRCSLPPFKHGSVVCKETPEQRERCYFQCQGGYVINPVSIFDRQFDCLDGSDDFIKLNSLIKRQEPCLLKKKSTIAQQELSLSFEGPCQPNDEGLKQELRGQIVDKLKQKSLCEWAQCSHGNITIHCGPPPPKRRGATPDTFDMRWNVTIENIDGLSTEKVDTILLNIRLHLMTLAARPVTLALQQHYQTVASSVRTFPLVWACLPGEMIYPDGCVPCPAGTFHNSSSGRCRLCARGLWQDSPRQLNCHQCSQGFTKDEGALTDKECLTVPTIDEMSKFLIITACTFAVIFLGMVVFMYLQYQRQQRQAKQRMAILASNAHRTMSPNVYASPPIVKPLATDHIRRNSLDYIGCHDYEDIDGASTATKAMLQALSKSSYWHNRNNSLSRSSHRDSLTSFKSNGEVLFRIPSSPTAQASNSFKTSAETLTVQSSPRESHRSFQMGGAGMGHTEGFYNKPPMSPGVNSINTFRGSPVSPYKSLSISRGGDSGAGSISRLSPESPTRSPQLARETDSPYRLSNRGFDPESPYRLRESPYGRVMVTPSPFHQELQKSLKTSSANGAGAMGSADSGFAPLPYSPEFPRAVASVPDSPSRSYAASLPRSAAEPHHAFRSMPASPGGRNQSFPPPPPADGGSFDLATMGDTLYKRPSSPVSPLPSSRISSDSLSHRSPSTPRASPLASRRRIEASFKTPPLTRNKRSFTENSCYEYD